MKKNIWEICKCRADTWRKTRMRRPRARVRALSNQGEIERVHAVVWVSVCVQVSSHASSIATGLHDNFPSSWCAANVHAKEKNALCGSLCVNIRSHWMKMFVELYVEKRILLILPTKFIVCGTNLKVSHSLNKAMLCEPWLVTLKYQNWIHSNHIEIVHALWGAHAWTGQVFDIHGLLNHSGIAHAAWGVHAWTGKVFDIHGL